MTNLSIKRLRQLRGDEIDLSATRGLCDDDLKTFGRLCRKHKTSRVRVYGHRGFVPNRYKWRCDIQHIERDWDDDGEEHVSVGWGGAQRPHANGNTRVVVTSCKAPAD
jgi:hypothetical protein